GAHPMLHKVWRRLPGGTSPVIAGGLLYVYEQFAGKLVVYRPTTGKRVGTLLAATGHWNSPIVADGRVALGVGNANARPTSGRLAIFRKP
ncbi:MAG: hypothetical protein ACJ760_02350, partial [Thermoleophilaceae bacterium]